MCSEWLSFIISKPWEVSLPLPRDGKFSTWRFCDNFPSFLFRVNTNPHAGISFCLCTVVISREQRSNSVNPRSTCAHCLQAVCGSTSLSYLGDAAANLIRDNRRTSKRNQTVSILLITSDTCNLIFSCLCMREFNICTSHYSKLIKRRKNSKISNK